MIAFFAISSLSSIHLNSNDEKSFLSWMRNTNNIYTGDQYHFRLRIFIAKKKYVQTHNSDKSKTFKLKLNRFAVLTPSEYKSILTFKPYLTPNIKKVAFRTTERNEVELDWRVKGAVNKIKDQGSCGSCWAFSAIQNCESAEFLKYNSLYNFSEQALVDCDTSNNGCQGGLPSRAFDYIINKCGGKVMLETDYLYTGTDDACQYDQSKAIGHFTHFIQVESGNETDLALTCQQYGPCSIGIDASHVSFQLYSSGIYDEHGCMARNVNHGVGLVGYGSENIHAGFVQQY